MPMPALPTSLDPLTIVFALAALVVVWKLWGVLGARTGLERRRQDHVAAPARRMPTPPQPVIRLPGAAPGIPDPARWTAYVEPGARAEPGLDAIATADPSFAGGPFLNGAKAAYEAVLAGFASGDRKILQTLLEKDVYDGFDAALAEREKSGSRLSTTIVSLDETRINAAALDNRMARVAVRFQSKQITATHAADGALIDGSAERIVEIRDLWTFARDVKSRDPNWKLAGTEAGH